MNSLGQRIRELRIKKGITQIDLSKDICTPSMISQIESDRARPSYKILFAIAERLDVPLEKLLADVEMNLEYVSTYKMSRAMVASKEYASAIPLLKDLLNTPRAQISPLEIMFDLAECYLYTKQYDEANRLFSEIYETANEKKDHLLLTNVLLGLGHIEYYRKRYQLAAYQWQKALEMANKLEDPDSNLKAHATFHLGLAHEKLGQLSEAIDYYRQASGLYKNLDSLHDIGNVYMGLGLSYKHLHDLEKAVEYSEKATAIFEALENMAMTVKLSVHCAVLYGQAGRVEEAITMLRSAIVKFHDLGKPDEEGSARIELAKLLVEKGDLDGAEETCHQARALLPELHVYQAWLNRLLGQIALQRGRHTDALRRYQKAADCFKELEEFGPWDATMYDIARLHQQAQEMQQAFDTMDEIRTYSHQFLEKRGIVL